MKTARLIITLDCPRSCPYCCNKQGDMLESATRISDLRELDGYDEVCVTGGEPMIDPWRTMKIVAFLQTFDFKKIYLYTAMFGLRMDRLLKMVDGVHYTLHAPLTRKDVNGFYRMQALVSDDPDKSCRLYIDPGIISPITIYPDAWARVEVKPWLDDCPLPPNETLFILEDEK